MYREILTNGAVYLATPNQFEMEVLTDVKIKDLQTLKTSITRFHTLYPRVQYVVITSMDFAAHEGQNNVFSELICACSELNSKRAHYFVVPKIEAQFSGSGDLCSALLLDVFLSQDSEARDLSVALNKVLSLIDSILRKTFEIHQTTVGSHQVKINDLRLIESRDLLIQDIPLKYTSVSL